MKEICSATICTGCGICVSQCPKKCISMKTGYLGHLFPEINQSQCIDCGLCKKNCPSLSSIDANYPIKAFAAWTKDQKDYETSTSGGAASVLSRYILLRGGVVYGCCVMPEVKITHIRIDNINELYKLKGSKYVQSSITSVIPQIKKDIKEGRHTLFIGTPCQVSAIKKLFKEYPKNLYLVDIICHGTPSNKFLSDYITKNLQIPLNQVTQIIFRLPNSYSLCLYNKTKLLYKSNNLWTNRYEDLYYNTFIDGFTFRPSCFLCKYATPQRVSDITIGDFWGLGNEAPDDEIPEHNSGISCILPISKKGEELIYSIRNNLNIYERPITEAINGNEQLRTPKKKDWRIRMFHLMIRFMPISTSYYILNCDRILKYKINKKLNI